LSSPARESIFLTSTPGSSSAFSGSGLPMTKMGIASRSHSSNGSIRIKIDGNPLSASLASMAINMITPASDSTDSTPVVQSEQNEKEDDEEEEPPTPTRSTLTRASVDVNALNNRIPIVLPHRPSLPTSTVGLTSPPRSAFSPILGSPRSPDSPHFTRPDFGPVPTPPSLIANPKSLGDPFPKGVPSSSSRNLAALASAEEMHGLGHLRSRSSGRIIDRYARGPLSPPRKLSPPDLQLQASAVIEAPVDEETTEVAANPYFA
jgi:hypothetical protein